MTRRVMQQGRLALVCLGLALAACTSPVRAIRVDPTLAHRDLTRSAVTTDQPSWPTRNALMERGLLEEVRRRPDAGLAALHRAMVEEGGNPDLLLPLAELSFLYAEVSGKREHQLAAAVYAYAFLFPGEGGGAPEPFDPRLRLAADLYNWALTAAFASENGSEVVPRGASFALPFGEIAVAFDPAELRVGNRELYRFVPVAQLEVKGLKMRYRQPGIGAPLAASTRPVAGAAGRGDMVAPNLQVPVTALLRIPQVRRGLVEAQPLRSSLELRVVWEDESVAIDGESVPLEIEPTAALALTFTDAPIAQLELLGFFGRLTGLLGERPPLVSTTPYRPGLVPVVFVHGTASSPVRWAELYNRLNADPEVRRRYQFWFFQYDSNRPIALSALRLRQALAEAVAQLDPQGRDPALHRMVLIGHSQGGLLVKMQAIASGDRIWNALSRKPVDELRLSRGTRELIRQAFFVEPLPGVSRVIFISTPHRGSYLASQSVANLLRRFTILPAQLAGISADLALNRDAARTPFAPTAVDNMSPRHPFVRALQEIPVAPGIEAHSIISVKEGFEPVEEGNDGVVAYSSAHIEGVESERVVRSPHSCQGHPDTMEEVRRILRLHAGLAVPSEAPAE